MDKKELNLGGISQMKVLRFHFASVNISLSGFSFDTIAIQIPTGKNVEKEKCLES